MAQGHKDKQLEPARPMLIALQPIQCALNEATVSVLSINLEEEPAGILLLLVRRWRGAPPTPTAPSRAQSAPNGANANALSGGTGCWDLEAPPAQSFIGPPPPSTPSQEAAPAEQWLLMTSNNGDRLEKKAQDAKNDIFLQTPQKDSYQEPRATDIAASLTTSENGQAERYSAPAQPLTSYRGPVKTPL